MVPCIVLLIAKGFVKMPILQSSPGLVCVYLLFACNNFLMLTIKYAC